MKTKHILMTCALILGCGAFIACQEKEENKPEVKNPEIKLSASVVEALPEGGTYSIGYTLTNPTEGVSIDASCSADWISAFTFDETGKISFTVAANDGKENRETEVQIVYPGIDPSPKFSVLQAAPYIFSVTPEEDVNMPAEGGNVSFTVAHNVDYTVKVDVEWIKQDNGTKAYSEEKVSFTVLANDTAEERSATITFSANDSIEIKINVKQAGANLNPLDDPDEYFLPMIDALGMVYEESGIAEYEASLGHTPDSQFPGFWTFKTGKKLFFMTGYLNGWEGTVNEVILKSEDAENIRSAQVRAWVEGMDFEYVQTRSDGDDTFKHKEKDLWLLLHYTPYGATDFPGVQFSNVEYEYW